MSSLLDILQIVWITFIPVLELRASIPYGMLLTDLPKTIVFAVCVASNIIVGILVFVFVERVVRLANTLTPFKKVWESYVLNIQKKMHKAVDKYGWLGVAVFIGIPLPGTGVYSGALASYLIGMRFKKFLAANIIGVLIAAIIVTAVTISGISALGFFLKV